MAVRRKDGRGKLKQDDALSRRFSPYKVMHREARRTYDRIFATVYGQCVGDALGLLTENLTKEECKRVYGGVSAKLELVHRKLRQDTHRSRWELYDWTDETDQMILILQSIVGNRGQVVPKDFGRRILDWSDNGFPELKDRCGPGLDTATKAVLAHPQFSETPQQAAEIVWRNSGCVNATNTAVARTSVLGLHYYTAHSKVMHNALEICNTTHPDPRCHASVVAVTTAITLMMQRDEKHLKKNGDFAVDAIITDCFTYATRCLLGRYPEIKELKRHMFASSLKDLQLNEVGRTNFTLKTVGAAFWAFRQKDFRSAIQDIVMEGGDADANAAVAGALLGCKLGLSAIPHSWIESLVNRRWLDGLMEEYLNMMERGQAKPKVETTV
ncbi:ADP-ribosylarginine hydrolase Tri1-like [Babylonia areolata]|uniref:ADP-ribosylarginine hydrolase Tri1-like n=1 Tax=Babylonia areolata TaxID=304850 RepID=UPI003FD0CFC8